MQPKNSDFQASKPHPLLDMLSFTYRDRLEMLENQRVESGESQPAWNLRVLTRPAAALLQPPVNSPAGRPGRQLILSPRKGPANRRAAAEIDRLMTELSDLPEHVENLMGTMNLCIVGAPADEAVYSLPDFLDHFAAVNAQWPYWLHFLAPSKENMTLLILMLSRSKTFVKGSETARIRTAEMSMDEIFRHLKQLVLASVNLQQASGIPTARCREHSRQVLKAIGQALTPAAGPSHTQG
jgi:hypothetical protein